MTIDERRLRAAMQLAAQGIEADAGALTRLRAGHRRAVTTRAVGAAATTAAVFGALSLIAVTVRPAPEPPGIAGAALGDVTVSETAGGSPEEPVGLPGEPKHPRSSAEPVASRGRSGAAAISADGRVAVFVSEASDLVPSDVNGVTDVFARDLTTGTIVRVSTATGGVAANGPSGQPSVSDDGRVVAFTSRASNLVATDTNRVADVFVRDLAAGTTTRVSVSGEGVEANAASSAPAIAGDGETVVFTSGASNLVSGDSNGLADVFAHDRRRGSTERVSRALLGEPDGPSDWGSLSRDGRFAAFTSEASNLVVEDRNGVADVFVLDRTTGVVERVARRDTDPDGRSIFPAISGDGGTVVLLSTASNLVDEPVACRPSADGPCLLAYAYDRAARAIRTASPPDAAGVFFASVSDDGGVVALSVEGSGITDDDLHPGRDVFLLDLRTGTTALISAGPSGVPANGPSGGPRLSGDGRAVAFQSFASNLVARDGDDRTDVFVYDVIADTVTRISGPSRPVS